MEIDGHSGNSRVEIHDPGTSGGLVVVSDGVSTTITSTIYWIDISLRGGSDQVLYQLEGNLQEGVSRIVDLNLGDGNDKFTAFLVGSLRENSNLRFLDVEGGKGDDRYEFHATGLKGFGGPGTDIAEGALLEVSLKGGRDQDKVFMNYRGEVDGDLRIFAAGWTGSDTIGVYLQLDEASQGQVGSVGEASKVRGDDEHDNLTFYVNDTSSATIFARLEGSGGRDTGQYTYNVTPSRIENSVPVPWNDSLFRWTPPW